MIFYQPQHIEAGQSLAYSVAGKDYVHKSIAPGWPIFTEFQHGCQTNTWKVLEARICCILECMAFTRFPFSFSMISKLGTDSNKKTPLQGFTRERYRGLLPNFLNSTNASTLVLRCLASYMLWSASMGNMGVLFLCIFY